MVAMQLYWKFYLGVTSFKQKVQEINTAFRGGSRTAATSKDKLLSQIIIINNNYYHKVLHLECCSSRRSASGIT